MAKAPSPKKEVMSLRIEPKLRYLIDIAARIQRRNITNYVEWALEESLHSVYLENNFETIDKASTLDFLKDRLWDINESKRFVTLAIHYPDLLTFEEQKLWDVITKHPYLYLKKCPGAWIDDNINFNALNDDWELLLHASYGHEEPLKILKEAQAPLIPTANNYLYENEWQALKEFIENNPKPKTKEEYEQYTKELHEAVLAIEDIIRSKGE